MHQEKSTQTSETKASALVNTETESAMVAQLTIVIEWIESSQ